MKNTFKDSLLLSFDSAQDDGEKIFPSIMSAEMQNAQIDGRGELLHLFIHNLYF